MKHKSFQELLNDNFSDLCETYRRGGGLPGVPTGFAHLDDVIGGLQKGHSLLLAARSAMGKTALATSLAGDLSRKYSVGFLSLEQPASELVYRMVADVTGHDLKTLKRTPLGETELRRIRNLYRDLENDRMHIWETFNRDWDQVKVEIAAMAEEHEFDVLFVDHLNLVRGKGPQRHLEIAQICEGLKNVAKDLNLPIVSLCQVNRAAENRDDARPTLANLKEGSALEENADTVVLIYRKEYYLLNAPQPDPLEDPDGYDEYLREMGKHRGKADLIVAKNRHGERAVCTVGFNAPRMKFHDLQGEGK